MTIQMGITGSPLHDGIFKRKFRWTIDISGVTGTSGSNVINLLPPSKSARPSLSFKEMELQHLSETVYFPTKPDWKPLDLVLFDLNVNLNPVYAWIGLIYNVCRGNGGNGVLSPSVGNGFKKTATISMLDGGGNICEAWEYQNCWPQVINFGDLDYSSSDYMTIDLTLRYDRARCLTECNGTGGLAGSIGQLVGGGNIASA